MIFYKNLFKLLREIVLKVILYCGVFSIVFSFFIVFESHPIYEANMKISLKDVYVRFLPKNRIKEIMENLKATANSCQIINQFNDKYENELELKNNEIFVYSLPTIYNVEIVISSKNDNHTEYITEYVDFLIENLSHQNKVGYFKIVDYPKVSVKRNITFPRVFITSYVFSLFLTVSYVYFRDYLDRSIHV